MSNLKFCRLDYLLDVQNDFYRGRNGRDFEAEFSKDEIDQIVWEKQDKKYQATTKQRIKEEHEYEKINQKY